MLWILFMVACFDKERTAPITDPQDDSDTEISDPSLETAEPTSEPSEPTTEPSEEPFFFSCGPEECTHPGQYCYQLYPGVPDTGGLPDPSCELFPSECSTTPSCSCLLNLGFCTDCQERDGGVFCDMYAAKK